MLTLLVLTAILALAAFQIPSPWREAIAIVAVVALTFLWLNWLGVFGPSGRWV